MGECPYCHNHVEPTWNFCRRCGARLFQDVDKEPEVKMPVEEPAREEPSSPTGVIYERPLEIEEEKEEEEKELTDDELVERISETIIKRDEYNELLRKRKELSEEIDILLDRLKHKLIPREEALPKIGQLKEEANRVKTRLKEFEDFSAILPIEEIIEDRNNERKKLKKLRSLKGDKAISKATYEEMEAKYKKNIELLNTKLNIELAKMKKTFNALQNKMKSLQRELEILYVKSQTGEITEKQYEKEKQKISEEISKFKKVAQTVQRILTEAK